MICENCGSNVDGMKFCKHCGTKVENASAEKVTKPTTTSKAKTVKVTAKDLNMVGYIIIFSPFLWLILEWLSIGLGAAVVNTSFWVSDKMLLKKGGYTGKWTWWGLLLMPVYMYYRCKNVDGNFKKLTHYIIVLVIYFILALITL